MPDPRTTAGDMNAIYRELHTFIMIESFHFVVLSAAILTACALLISNRWVHTGHEHRVHHLPRGSAEPQSPTTFLYDSNPWVPSAGGSPFSRLRSLSLAPALLLHPLRWWTCCAMRANERRFDGDFFLPALLERNRCPYPSWSARATGRSAAIRSLPTPNESCLIVPHHCNHESTQPEGRRVLVIGWIQLCWPFLQ